MVAVSLFEGGASLWVVGDCLFGAGGGLFEGTCIPVRYAGIMILFWMMRDRFRWGYFGE